MVQKNCKTGQKNVLLTLLQSSVKQKTMVFKRPGNSRDDRSKGSPGRRRTGDDKPSKTGSSRPSKSSNSGFDKAGARPGRNNHGEGTRDPQKSFSSERRKPYSGRPESGDAPVRRSSGGSYEPTLVPTCHDCGWLIARSGCH